MSAQAEIPSRQQHVATTFNTLATTSGTGTTYAHTSLAAGNTRHYKVSAINSVGTGLASNVADATTDAAGICGRTEAVRDMIVAMISGVTDCADVTDTHLAAITTTLNLFGNRITALADGDFDGLTRLTRPYLNGNSLTALPGGVFDELTALTQLRLNSNPLAALPADAFDGLTALTMLRLSNLCRRAGLNSCGS